MSELEERLHKLARKHSRYYRQTGRYTFTLAQLIEFARSLEKELCQ